MKIPQYLNALFFIAIVLSPSLFIVVILTEYTRVFQCNDAIISSTYNIYIHALYLDGLKVSNYSLVTGHELYNIPTYQQLSHECY